MRKTWNRWKFHLSAMVLGASVFYGPGYVSGAHWADMGERVLAPAAIGPFKATLAEEVIAPPRRDPYGELLKDYNVILSPEGAKAVKAAWLRIGPPVFDEEHGHGHGEILGGNPYRLHGHVHFPDSYGADDLLWLTVETWDGDWHAASWPLAEALGVLAQR